MCYNVAIVCACTRMDTETHPCVPQCTLRCYRARLCYSCAIVCAYTHMHTHVCYSVAVVPYSILTTPLLLRSHAAERLAGAASFAGNCVPRDKQRQNFLALACQAKWQDRAWPTANHQGGGGSRPSGCATGHDTRPIRQHRVGSMCTSARRCTPCAAIDPPAEKEFT